MDRMDNHNKENSIQSNDLIRAAYSVTLSEKKLLLKAISKIDSFNPIKKDGCIVVDIQVSECTDLFNKANIWREMTRAAATLQSRTVTLFPTKDKRQEISWVDTCTYVEKKSLINIKFSQTVSTKLTGLLEQYTQIPLLDVAQLKSIHSVRLFELLKLVENDVGRGWLNISCDEFREVMGLANKYSSFGPLNNRVIVPSLKELNGNSKWDITLEKVKKGKAVHMLKFKFQLKAQVELDLKEKTEPVVKKKVKPAKLSDNPQSRRQKVTASIMDIHDTNW